MDTMGDPGGERPVTRTCAGWGDETYVPISNSNNNEEMKTCGRVQSKEYTHGQQGKEEGSHSRRWRAGYTEEGWPGPCGVIREEGGVVNSLWNTPAAPLHSPTPVLATSESVPLSPSLASTPTLPLEQGGQRHQVGQDQDGVQPSFYLTSGNFLYH